MTRGRGTRTGWHRARQRITEVRSGEAVEYLCGHEVVWTGEALCHSKNKQRGLGGKNNCTEAVEQMRV